MIQSIKFECCGRSIDLMTDPDMKVVDIQGISQKATINTSSTNGYDGESVVSSQAPMRNISLAVRFTGGDAEESKYRLYSCFPAKGEGVLFYTTSTRRAMIRCIVESCDIPPNVYPLMAQISLLCPDPYFADCVSNNQIMAGTKPLFKFPHHFTGPFQFSKRDNSVIDNFYNDGTTDMYPIVIFKALGELTNPSLMNISTYEKMKVNISMVTGDIIVIDTRIGQKTIIKNDSVNIFNTMDSEFTFLKLYIGDNYLKYNADTNPLNLQVTVIWNTLYGGM